MAAALPLGACDTLMAGQVPGPASVSDRTKLDEQVGIAVTLAYTAAAKAAGLAIETGLIKNQDTIRRIGAADQKAYAAVMAVRSAYLTVNATEYTEALARANAALSEFTALFGARTSYRMAPATTYRAALASAAREHETRKAVHS
jgi:hypothetical protein